MEHAVDLINWETDYTRALDSARDQRRQLLVYFHKPN